MGPSPSSSQSGPLYAKTHTATSAKKTQRGPQQSQPSSPHLPGDRYHNNNRGRRHRPQSTDLHTQPRTPRLVAHILDRSNPESPCPLVAIVRASPCHQEATELESLCPVVRRGSLCPLPSMRRRLLRRDQQRQRYPLRGTGHRLCRLLVRRSRGR